MHYYAFNIGLYASHTAHLDPLEDIAYRRLLDLYYTSEKPITLDVEEAAELIRMRSHIDTVRKILQKFFCETEKGFSNKRADKEIKEFRSKSKKAKESAEARWQKTNKKQKVNDDANALRTHSERIANAMPTQSERNANQEPITNNQEPITNLKDMDCKQSEIDQDEKQAEPEKPKRFTPPTLAELGDYFFSKQSTDLEAKRFFDFYESNGWKVGKNKMVNWRSAASGWITRNEKLAERPSGYLTAREKSAARNAEIFDFEKATTF